MSNPQLPVVGITHNKAFPVEREVVRRSLDSLAVIRMIEMPSGTMSAVEEALAIDRLRDVVAVLFRPGVLSRNMLAQCHALRLIAVHGAGVDKVDLQAASDLGITVTNAPGANAIGVAELAIALAVTLVRQIGPMASATKSGLWDEARQQGTELAGKTLGILGVGHVGSKVASRALGFEMVVHAYDPAYAADQLAIKGIRWMPFEQVLETADVLSLHVPLDARTYHLLDEPALRRMKPGAYLLNLSRGPVIDETALVQALRDGRLAGAALDVREEEPPGGNDSLRSLPNVIVTPHVGGSTHEALARIAQVCADEIARFLRDEPPVNVVVMPTRTTG